MSYQFKGKFVKLAGKNNVLVPSSLPENPQNGTICIDLNDSNKLKYFDGTNWIDTSSTNLSKKNGILILCYNGSGTDNWLGFGDKLVPTNDAAWSPPFDCHITQVQFTNKRNGNSSTKTVNEVRCHQINYSENRSITTEDTTAWYVNNWGGSNLIRESGYGRTWEYDNSSEGDHLYKDKKYAFRVRNLQGANPADIIVTLLIEEI